MLYVNLQEGKGYFKAEGKRTDLLTEMTILMSELIKKSSIEPEDLLFCLLLADMKNEELSGLQKELQKEMEECLKDLKSNIENSKKDAALRAFSDALVNKNKR